MAGRGRKHKRGERGSVEQEQSDSKRTNMATVEGVTLARNRKSNHRRTSERTQPNRLTRDISRYSNNRKIIKSAKTLKQLKSTLNKQQTEIVDLKKQLSKFKHRL